MRAKRSNLSFWPLEHIKVESSLFAGLLYPWLRQKHCGILTNMPYVSSLPRTNPQRKNANSQLFNALDCRVAMLLAMTSFQRPKTSASYSLLRRLSARTGALADMLSTTAWLITEEKQQLIILYIFMSNVLNLKFEYRNSKQIRNPKLQKLKQQRNHDGRKIGVFFIWILNIRNCLEFSVSYFVFLRKKQDLQNYFAL